MKIGPDYLDTMLHSAVTGVPGNNLDRWIQGRAYRRLLASLAEKYDYAVLEGVMGLFDSGSPKDLSSYYYFNALGIPYILVVNVAKLAESAYYVAKGFLTKLCKGVIINDYYSERHLEMASSPFRQRGIRIVGAVPHDDSISLEERHLGLRTDLDPSRINEIASRVSSHIDFSFIDNLPEINISAATQSSGYGMSGLRFAVALDSAFNFYYSSSLRFMELRGKVEYFSPLNGEIPEDPDFIYIGGGYPELFAEKLSRVSATRDYIKNFSLAGGVILSECGGLMYLEDKLFAGDRVFNMCGVFDGKTLMKEKPVIGYTKLRAMSDTFLFRKNETLYGHEFHYSLAEDSALKVLNNEIGRGIDGTDGLYKDNTLATYSHFDLSRYGKRIVRNIKPS